MAISRAQLLKELLPGLNKLFGLEYNRYGEQHKEIYEVETSERAFEEEVKLSGFGAAPVKNEGDTNQTQDLKARGVVSVACHCSQGYSVCEVV